jgi:5-formyltetrahydrofolate cyclo-ligase
MSKPNDLRQAIRAQRLALSDAEQQAHAATLMQHLISDPIFLAAQKLAFYYPVMGEMSPGLLLEYAANMGKTCYLPVLHPAENCLLFAVYQPGDALTKNRCGVLEPVAKEKLLSAENLDWIALPLVAFDKHGTRLGMGAGYYDRTLAFTLGKPLAGRPFLLGLAHSFQEVAQLERQAWDVPLDAVFTETQGVRTCPFGF